MQRINICDEFLSQDVAANVSAKCHRAGLGVMLLASGSSVTAMKLESESVGIALTCHLEHRRLGLASGRGEPACNVINNVVLVL